MILIFISLMINDAVGFFFFHVLAVCLYVFFGTLSIQTFCSFLIGLFLLILSCMSFLYTLDINPLSYI